MLEKLVRVCLITSEVIHVEAVVAVHDNLFDVENPMPS